MAFVVLIGAAGVGKSTIADAVGSDEPDVQIAHFAALGTPSDEAAGDPEMLDAWRKATMVEWIRRLAPAVAAGTPVLLEGDIRFDHLEDAAADAGGVAYIPVLIDCDDGVRRDRAERGEITDDDVAARLRDAAAERGCRVIDTTMRGVNACMDEVIRLVRR